MEWRWDAILAIIGVLVGIGKFLDDHYVTPGQKESVAAFLQQIFDWLERVRMPDVPEKMASWFFQSDTPGNWSVSQGPAFWAYVITVGGYLHMAFDPAWWQIAVVAVVAVPIALLGVAVAYLPERRVFIKLNTHRWRFVRWLAVPVSIILPTVLFLGVSRYLFSLRHLTGIWGDVAEGGGLVVLLTTIPFLMICVVIALIFIAKVVVNAVNLIFSHIFKKASADKKPFSYAMGVVSVLLLIGKAMVEVAKVL